MNSALTLPFVSASTKPGCVRAVRTRSSGTTAKFASDWPAKREVSVYGKKTIPGLASTLNVRSPPKKSRFSQPASPCTSTRVPASTPNPIFRVLSSVGVSRNVTGTATTPCSLAFPIGASLGATSTDPKTRSSLSALWARSSRYVE